MKVYAKGVLATGTAGVGFIFAGPGFAAASDVNCGYFSDATYTGTTFIGAGVGVNPFTTNSEYLSAQFGNSAILNQYRIVSAGLRVRYIGTELNRGGQLVAFCDPNHQQLTSRNIVDIDGELESRRFAIHRQWVTVLYKPVFQAENDFATSFPPIPSADVYMGIIIAAASVGTSLSYEWEFYVNLEVLGRNIRTKTVSEYDPLGYAAVHNASQMSVGLLPNSSPEHETEKAMVVASHDRLNTVVSGVNNAVKMIANAPWSDILNGVESIFSVAAPFLE